MRVKERNRTRKPEAFKENSLGTEKCCCTTFCPAYYTSNKVKSRILALRKTEAI